MALSRWSHSDHYIYDCGKNEDGEEALQICLFGKFSVSQILQQYNLVETRAKLDGYGFFSRLELKLYLKSWALFQTSQISRKEHVSHLMWLRRYGIVCRYTQDPWHTDFRQRLRFYFGIK